jgi:cytochrome c oxidase subunit II
MNQLSDNYTFGLPIAASTYAPRVDLALNILHVGMITIFVLWALFFTYCLIRFRKGRNPKADSNVGKWAIQSFIPDAAILAFELWLIFVFGLPIWSQVKEEFPTEQDATVVEMIAEQFAWSFHYAGPDGIFGRRDPKLMNADNQIGLDTTDPAAADDIVTLNDLHVPLGKPTLLYMTSKDVIHSFFVPEFRTKQDVVPGMRSPLWFEATQTGPFEIGCAQLCGLGHYRMKGQVLVHNPEDFEKTLKELKQASMEQSS